MKKIILLLVAFIAISGYTYAQVNSGHQTNPPAPVMVQSSINTAKTSNCKFLVIEDNLPWGNSAITDYLTANGEVFSIANRVTFPGLNFADYDVIIVASDQNPDFHVVYQANFPKFVAFVQGGGSLEAHSATCGWNSPCGYSVQLPGGVYTVEQYDNVNNVVDPLNPIAAGIPNPFSGTYASHGYFANLVAGTEIITTAASNGKPTTIQYHFGSGLVSATCCTYEYGCGAGEVACTMLHNNLNYSCDHAIAAIPTMGEWGLILLGVALLGVGIAYIMKRQRTNVSV
jgi:hypothetical protein